VSANAHSRMKAMQVAAGYATIEQFREFWNRLSPQEQAALAERLLVQR
jgi:hypothetical protein